MYFVYNVLVAISGTVLKLLALVNPKLKLFVGGRATVLETLTKKISASDQTLWFHAASLGEYEQGLPLIEEMKLSFPNHKIVLTFFSPSGYEVRKNNPVADVTVYLPLDTKQNVKQFLDAVHPSKAFFIKYEYWPNYLNALGDRNIPTYLISGILRKEQPFFKWYGGFYRKALNSFTHFFVQNSQSKELLASLGKHNATVSGDTRFDRVAAILEKDNTLGFISNFKQDKLLVVAGSTWPKDESLLQEYINDSPAGVKFIIAPHNIKKEQINDFCKGLGKRVVLFSEYEKQNVAECDVFIIDTIGILTKIYSYADIAYVGGGFGNPGIHNILEPATFGIPMIIGPNYKHFAEANALVSAGGCVSVNGYVELRDELDNLVQNDDIRRERGHICGTFVQMNKNAVRIIMKHFAANGDIPQH